MKKLRDYQKECIDAIIANFKEHILVSVPTGAGKSLIQAELITFCLKFPEVKIAVIVPSKELVQQNYNELKEYSPDLNVSINCAGLKQRDLSGDVVISTINSIYSKTEDELGKIDIIIIDEAHLIPIRNEGMYRDFIAFHPKARIVGLTATPFRIDGGFLYGKDKLFSKLVYEVKVPRLIKNKYLVPVVSYSGSKHVETTGINKTAGDFNKKQLEQAFIDQGVTPNACIDIIAKTKNLKHVLIFASGIKHGKLIQQELGNQAELLTGNCKDRDEKIGRFKSGQTKYLINVGVLTTGFNFPALQCIVLLRATQSTSLYVQMLGRGMRIAEGKDSCLLLDYGNNVITHGTVDCLNPIIKNKPSKKKTHWECKKCSKYNPYALIECECGYKRERIERGESIELQGTSYDGLIHDQNGESSFVIDVKSLKCKIHTSRAKNKCIRIDYYKEDLSPKNGVVFFSRPVHSEYIALNRVNLFNEFCLKHGVLPTATIEEFLEKQSEIAVPKSLVVRKINGFNCIMEKIF